MCGDSTNFRWNWPTFCFNHVGCSVGRYNVTLYDCLTAPFILRPCLQQSFSRHIFSIILSLLYPAAWVRFLCEKVCARIVVLVLLIHWVGCVRFQMYRWTLSVCNLHRSFCSQPAYRTSVGFVLSRHDITSCTVFVASLASNTSFGVTILSDYCHSLPLPSPSLVSKLLPPISTLQGDPSSLALPQSCRQTRFAPGQLPRVPLLHFHWRNVGMPSRDGIKNNCGSSALHDRIVQWPSVEPPMFARPGFKRTTRYIAS